MNRADGFKQRRRKATRTSSSRFLLVLVLAITLGVPAAQAQYPAIPNPVVGPFPDTMNMTYLSQLVPSAMGVTSAPIFGELFLSDIWGWESPAGEEYALIGTIDGLSIVRVTNPETPEFMGIVPGTVSSVANLWRDIGVFNRPEGKRSAGRQGSFSGYAYVTTEADGTGIVIVELNQLDSLSAAPSPTYQLSADATWSGGGYDSAHNIYINDDSGFAYVTGVGLVDGNNACNNLSPAPRFNTLILDLNSNPLNPPVVACIPDRGEHDIYVVNYKGPDKDYTNREIAYVFDGRERDASGNTSTAVGYGGLTEIWDVTDKSNIQIISSFEVPGLCFSHHGWTSKNEEFLLINDELDEVSHGDICPNEPVFDHPGLYVIDIRDLDNPVLQERVQIAPHGNDHNIYRVNNTLYWAAYSAGARVFEMKRTKKGGTVRLFLEEIAYMDTEPRNYPDFFGLWGIFAFKTSGTIIGSDIVNGLIVMKVDR